jgi:hypothetical protein
VGSHSGYCTPPSLPSFPHAVYAVMILPLRDCFRVSQGKSGVVADRLQILKAQYVQRHTHARPLSSTHAMTFSAVDTESPLGVDVRACVDGVCRYYARKLEQLSGPSVDSRL